MSCRMPQPENPVLALLRISLLEHCNVKWRRPCYLYLQCYNNAYIIISVLLFPPSQENYHNSQFIVITINHDHGQGLTLKHNVYLLILTAIVYFISEEFLFNTHLTWNGKKGIVSFTITHGNISASKIAPVDTRLQPRGFSIVMSFEVSTESYNFSWLNLVICLSACNNTKKKLNK